MAEYIEREALLGKLQNYITVCGYDYAIRYAPAADVAPVVHGRWIVKKNYHHGHYIDTECFCSECNTVGSPQWKGCPVCLARMDGE